jgi:altronate dehydratase small subunit
MNTNNRVYDAILLNQIDNVITSIRSLKKDQVINIKVNEKIIKIRLIDDIPICHKISINEIKTGENVKKYGEVIGIAFNFINKGSHVHIHNVKSLRG